MTDIGFEFRPDWSDRQMLSWLNTPEPIWDRPFRDGPRLDQCVEGFEPREKLRITRLIRAYWGGKIATTEFITRFNSGDDPPPEPQAQELHDGEYTVAADGAITHKGERYTPAEPYGVHQILPASSRSRQLKRSIDKMEALHLRRLQEHLDMLAAKQEAKAAMDEYPPMNDYVVLVQANGDKIALATKSLAYWRVNNGGITATMTTGQVYDAERWFGYDGKRVADKRRPSAVKSRPAAWSCEHDGHIYTNGNPRCTQCGTYYDDYKKEITHA